MTAVDTRAFASRPDQDHACSRVVRSPYGTKILTFVAQMRRSTPRLRPFSPACERLDPRAVGCHRGGGRRSESRAETLDVTYHGRDYREVPPSSNDPADRPGVDSGSLGVVSPTSLADDPGGEPTLHIYPSRTYPGLEDRCSRRWLRAQIVLASDDAPVREVIRPGVDGLTGITAQGPRRLVPRWPGPGAG